MQTVIVRLSPPSGDGQLHGIVEIVGAGQSAPFTDDAALLDHLHDASRNGGTPNPTRTDD
jgi:hypothetical protein